MTDGLSLRRAVIGGETAPDDYLVIWDDLKGQISHDEIQAARRIAADRSRPWHRPR